MDILITFCDTLKRLMGNSQPALLVRTCYDDSPQRVKTSFKTYTFFPALSDNLYMNKRQKTTF